MIFDAGIFFVLLGLAVFFFFIKTPYKEAFMFMSCAIFFILGFVLYADNEVFFTVTEDIIVTEFNGTAITNTITTSSNSTYLILGNTIDEYNIHTKYLAVFLIITGIVTGLVSFVMFIRTDIKN